MLTRLTLAAALAASLATTAFAATDEAKPADATAPATAKKADWKNDPNRLVCTLDREVGSNRPKRICMTVAQRKTLSDATQQRMTDGAANNGIKGAGDSVSDVGSTGSGGN